jgi:sterol desaturase/sphingolipid hydroxylase (fatty acid hydroxylase superfamily)
MPIATIIVAALLGALTWTFLEYVIHRWLGHDARFRPNFFSREHIRHHARGDYFAPTWKKALLSLGALAVIAPPAVLLAGAAAGLAYTAGLVGFYVAYEILHRREHTCRGIGAYGRWARRHHFWHHFVDPSSNHGVTTPLWDLVFGTYRAPEVIAVPERLKMAWLTDPSSGDVYPELARHYRLRPARAAA